MSDHYQTIAERVETRLKIERSDFLGIAFPIEREEEHFAELTSIQKNHFDATHHCWAFRLFDGPRSRSSDAGEPSGTAGKPILTAIEGAALYDVGVVVVRWFGGVKLGTGGLSRAYRRTAAETLQRATVADRYLYRRLRVVVPFEAMGGIYRAIHPPDVVLVDEQFGEENAFLIDVRRSHLDALTKQLDEKRLVWTLP